MRGLYPNRVCACAANVLMRRCRLVHPNVPCQRPGFLIGKREARQLDLTVMIAYAATERLPSIALASSPPSGRAASRLTRMVLLRSQESNQSVKDALVG